MSTTNYTKQSILVNCIPTVLDTLPKGIVWYDTYPDGEHFVTLNIEGVEGINNEDELLEFYNIDQDEIIEVIYE